uniref:Uncharacterized protein n=1 Tax=Glossina morsitans morsitans TaxID=37546 RepID=A0A1B0GC05_GLOMM
MVIKDEYITMKGYRMKILCHCFYDHLDFRAAICLVLYAALFICDFCDDLADTGYAVNIRYCKMDTRS